MKRVRHSISFIRRKPAEACLLLRIASWVALLSCLIKVLPLPRVLSFVALPARDPSPHEFPITQERLVQLVDALLGIDFLCFTPTCWKRAPVLHRYLALYGIETRIVFGVRREKGASPLLLAGHAWLEAEGRPLFETSPPQYTTTYSFPA
ncbi:MAG: lasso peptide biosynthesis B2 protein [Pyrinomonadaceae bacterium]